MLILDRYSLMVETHDFEPIENSELQGIIDEVKTEAKMLEVFKNIRPNSESSKSFKEKKDYYESLIEQTVRLTDNEYNAEDKELCLAFVLSGWFLEDSEAEEHCASILEKYIDTEEVLSDEMWFMLESLKYHMLSKWMRDGMPDFDKVKSIVSLLKQNKARYEELTVKFEWA